ncbi:MAG: YetF domain-containing protein [Rhodanobacter sp.]
MFDISSLPDALVRGAVLSGAGLIWVIILVRLVGTRTLSKMTAFDFLVTLATASLLATAGASESWSGFTQAMAAITTLIAAQYLLSIARRRSDTVRRLMENEPMLLVRDGQFLDHALRQARMSRGDIMAKLREANVGGLEKVSAIVLETTGDISVLTSDAIHAHLLAGVRHPAPDDQANSP